MATITNSWYAAAKQQFLQNTLDLSEGSLAIAILDEDANFNTNDVAYTDAQDGEVLQNIDVTALRTTPSVNKTVLDVSDFTITGIVPDKFISAFILYNKDTLEPYVYWGDVPALPYRTAKNRIYVSFSNAQNKATQIQDGVEFFPDLFIKVTDVSFADLPGITRPTVSIPQTEKITSGANQRYKDLSRMASAHPLTGDLTRVFDVSQIIQSMKNLILTDFNELPFGNSIGGNIRQVMFELGTSTTESDVEEQIFNCLDNEPRITVEDVTVEYFPDKNGVSINILYYVNGLTTRQEYKQFLERI